MFYFNISGLSLIYSTSSTSPTFCPLLLTICLKKISQVVYLYNILYNNSIKINDLKENFRCAHKTSAKTTKSKINKMK